MADYLTLADLRSAIQKAISDNKASKTTLVDFMINQVYRNEIMVADRMYPMFWMVDVVDTLACFASASITGVSKADPCVVTVANTYSEGDLVSIYNITGMTELNNRTFRVGSAAQGLLTTAIPLLDLDGSAIDSSSYTAWSSGGTVHHRGLTLSQSVQTLVSAKWHDSIKMLPISIEESEGENEWWGDGTAVPSRYQHRKVFTAAGAETDQLIWFYGAGEAKDLRFRYEKRATKLTDAAHVPLLPTQFHHTIVAGAVARLAESKVQVENPSIWPNIYATQLGQLKRFNRAWWAKFEENKDKKAFMQ